MKMGCRGVHLQFLLIANSDEILGLSVLFSFLQINVEHIDTILQSFSQFQKYSTWSCDHSSGTEIRNSLNKQIIIQTSGVKRKSVFSFSSELKPKLKKNAEQVTKHESKISFPGFVLKIWQQRQDLFMNKHRLFISY